MNHDSPERPVELVAIINSFNRRALLERAVASLAGALRSARVGSAVIVFEAGSNDGSAEFLSTWRENHPVDNIFVIEASADRRSKPQSGRRGDDGSPERAAERNDEC